MVTTNYILHLNNSFKCFTEDSKITPFHVSLYMALFHKWNNAKFRNPISVARDDLMFLSKIGSANTYTKCLKELDEWGYIKYIPSHSYHIGSKIYMYTFNTTKNTTTTKTNNNAIDVSPFNTTTKTSAKDVRPYKNIINSLNNTNNLNSINDNEQYQKNNSNNFSDDNSKSNSKSEQGKKEKSPAKKEKDLSTTAQSRPIRPVLENVKNYFETKSWPTKEADKFYNHYESNGWLVGGKTPMANWMASAENWMINSVKFANDKKTGNANKPGGLTASTDKNYSEPL